MEELEADEDRHERELLDILKEERLEHVGSIVLGLNDALAGLSLGIAAFSFGVEV